MGEVRLVECAEVRDLLPEYALGVLSERDRARVDRHLAWCAGCRKEARELAEGAEVLATTIPAADPPAELEGHVVRAVARSSGGPRRRTSQVAAALAAAVAVASIGVAVAMASRVQRLEDAAATARGRAEVAAGEFEKVLEDLGGETPILAAPLAPAEGGEAGGRALLFDTAQGTQDFAVVIVGGLPQEGGPYRAYLMSPAGNRLAVGRLVPSAEGQLARYRFFFDDVSRYREVLVLDRDGHAVLVGTFGS
jgi:Putative zinc-finger